jgi:hypothetical protein
MPVDDKVVQAIIKQALAKAGGGGGCCDQVRKAFRDLQAQRQLPGNSVDLNLTAAEHYMFARFMVCSGHVSPTQMRVLVVGYTAKKILDSATGDPNREAVTSNPVSAPDVGVVGWGLKGVSDGSADHDRCNKGVSPPFWRPINEILGGPARGPY